ncbi:hypothetical protein B0H13DRAFT_1910352 [Mycena leptocephala]|nr:hypothetical protein B0H13DRAFT_1910352 [Mycena leptocephala]
MLFSTTKITVFLATVVAVSAQSGVFFSAPSCAGTELQTVEFTDGLCVPSNGAVSVTFSTGDGSGLGFHVDFYTDLAHQDLSFAIDLGPGESEIWHTWMSKSDESSHSYLLQYLNHQDVQFHGSKDLAAFINLPKLKREKVVLFLSLRGEQV